MDWNTAQARQQFSQLLHAATNEPQRIFKREKLVAAVIDAASFEQFKRWQAQQQDRTVGSAFAELRRICAEEDYRLEISARTDRENPFA
ncbi:MAG: prevent-host-death protein [Gammaproteobacteria bacterium]|nr:prevent-host-death protein [Gammaproteobacteria bacterium]